MDNQEQKPTQIVNGWLKGLGRMLDAEIQLEDEGLCALEFKDDFVIHVAASNETEGFHIYANIVPVPEDADQWYELLNKGLRFNLEQVEHLQGSLCLSPDYRDIMLCFSRSVEEFDEPGFVSTMVRFYDTCLGAREFLKASDLFPFGDGEEEM